MKNKAVIIGTLIGAIVGAGILYFGYKKFKEKSEPSLTKRQIRKLTK